MGLFDKLNPLKVIGDLVGTVFGGIDNLSTTEKEKLALKAQIMAAQQKATIRMAEIESAIISEQSAIIQAEATGHSWLQRNWRPLVMLEFAFIIGWNYIAVPIAGVPAATLDPEMWVLMKIGMGGYVFGRSVEKTAKIWKNGENSGD